ncbi:MAG: NTP transferase domain-containing protein [Planctomycetes bacterium]|nr:NTP transferase domain-containing protein [Planctomycetota bacterium]
MTRGPSTWGLVLAAGEGARLRTLTTDGAGRSVPKQFCSLRGGASLFGDAIARAQRVAAPERIVTIVAAEHRAHWEHETRELAPENVLVQPRNRGTAAGLLYPLLAIHEREPDARVVVLPSDHHVRDEGVLERSVREALSNADHDPDEVALLGIEPDAPVTDYGWIVPGAPRPGWRRPRRVAEFVEKPDAAVASDLFARGALWNSFLLAGKVEAFLDLYARRLPELVSAFTTALLARPTHRPAFIDMLYAGITPNDVSRDVLQNVSDRLNLVHVPPCGWTDLGTPERVARCLREEGVRARSTDTSRVVLANAVLR